MSPPLPLGQSLRDEDEDEDEDEELEEQFDASHEYDAERIGAIRSRRATTLVSSQTAASDISEGEQEQEQEQEQEEQDGQASAAQGGSLRTSSLPLSSELGEVDDPEEEAIDDDDFVSPDESARPRMAYSLKRRRSRRGTAKAPSAALDHSESGGYGPPSDEAPSAPLGAPLCAAAPAAEPSPGLPAPTLTAKEDEAEADGKASGYRQHPLAAKRCRTSSRGARLSETAANSNADECDEEEAETVPIDDPAVFVTVPRTPGPAKRFSGEPGVSAAAAAAANSPTSDCASLSPGTARAIERASAALQSARQTMLAGGAVSTTTSASAPSAAVAASGPDRAPCGASPALPGDTASAAAVASRVGTAGLKGGEQSSKAIAQAALERRASSLNEPPSARSARLRALAAPSALLVCPDPGPSPAPLPDGTPFPRARWGHAAASLGDGRVVVLGGEDDDGTPLGDVWSLGISTGRWSLERTGNSGGGATDAPGRAGTDCTNAGSAGGHQSASGSHFAPRVWHSVACVVRDGAPSSSTSSSSTVGAGPPSANRRVSLLAFGGERDVDTPGRSGTAPSERSGLVLTTRKQLQDPWLLMSQGSVLMGFPPFTSGKVPAARGGHTMTALGSSVLVHGGIRGSKWLGDLHCIDIRTFRWAQVRPVGPPPKPRCYHTAVTVADESVVIFGGNDADRSYNDVVVLRTATGSSNGSWLWERPTIKGTPPRARTGHTATLVSPRHMLVVGGWDPVNTVEESAGRRRDGAERGPAGRAGRGRPSSVSGGPASTAGGDEAEEEEEPQAEPIVTATGGPMYPDAFLLDLVDWRWSRVKPDAAITSSHVRGSSVRPADALARTGHAAVLADVDLASIGALPASGAPALEPCVVVIGGVGPSEERRLDAVAIRLPDCVLRARAAGSP